MCVTEGPITMTLSDSVPEYNPARLRSPTEALAYLKERYGIVISLASFYSHISRGTGPKPTYFRGRPKFYEKDIDEWVRNNLSPKRK
jgi:predicted DNA-binding transcriptional regulator AlpA